MLLCLPQFRVWHFGLILLKADAVTSLPETLLWIPFQAALGTDSTEALQVLPHTSDQAIHSAGDLL